MSPSRIQPELSAEALLAGIRAWRRTDFDRHFHAALYEDYANFQRAEQLTEVWWESIVDTLVRWRATRGPGFGRRRILKAGLENLGALNAAWRGVVAEEVKFGDAAWSALEPLFDHTRQLKPTKSPSAVFPSKLCHLLLPSLYVVWDRAAVGGDGDYPRYWQECSLGWARARELHSGLRDTLVREIGFVPGPSFPYATKISELCAIGTRVRTGGRHGTHRTKSG